MECPYCGQELMYHDYFGRYLGRNRWDKKGEIYKCENQECGSEIFNYFFYTRIDNENLQEGYPC